LVFHENTNCNPKLSISLVSFFVDICCGDNIIAPLKKMKLPIIKAETSQNCNLPLN